MDATERRTRFGKALRAARLNAGLSQAKLSGLIDKDQGMVSDYEAGRTDPGVDGVAALEHALELEPGALSRYLGWIPVDPAEAPEPPEVVTTRSVLPAETINAISQFGRSLEHVKIPMPDMTPAIQALRETLDGFNLANSASLRQTLESLQAAVPAEAIYRFADQAIVPLPAEMFRAADLVGLRDDGTVELIEVKHTNKGAEQTVSTPAIEPTTKVHEPAVGVEQRVDYLEQLVADLERRLENLPEKPKPRSRKKQTG